MPPHGFLDMVGAVHYFQDPGATGTRSDLNEGGPEGKRGGSLATDTSALAFPWRALRTRAATRKSSIGDLNLSKD